MRVQGKRVLITGAGRGLGRTLAQEFAAAGALVVLTDREAALVDPAVAELQAAGHRVAGYALDVTSSEEIATIRSRVLAEQGPLDILVNNAGIVFGGPFLTTPLERHQQTFAVNVGGVLAVTQAFLPDLLARPESHLVFIASASSFIALPYGTTYAASKWALLGFAESLREELRLQGQHQTGISCICPSYIDTGMFTGVRAPRFVPWLQPRQVALATLRAVEHKHERVLMPWLLKFVPFLSGVLPRWLCRRLWSWLGVSSSMADWRGHAG